MTKEELRKSLDFVCEERERLQVRIDKAIEYIKRHSRQEEMWFDNKKGELHQDIIIICKTDDLLNILEGKENDI